VIPWAQGPRPVKLPHLQFQLGDPRIEARNLVKGDDGQNKAGK
jgi:hypothetical protein